MFTFKRREKFQKSGTSFLKNQTFDRYFNNILFDRLAYDALWSYDVDTIRQIIKIILRTDGNISKSKSNIVFVPIACKKINTRLLYFLKVEYIFFCFQKPTLRKLHRI